MMMKMIMLFFTVFLLIRTGDAQDSKCLALADETVTQCGPMVKAVGDELDAAIVNCCESFKDTLLTEKCTCGIIQGNQPFLTAAMQSYKDAMRVLGIKKIPDVCGLGKAISTPRDCEKPKAFNPFINCGPPIAKTMVQCAKTVTNLFKRRIGTDNHACCKKLGELTITDSLINHSCRCSILRSKALSPTQDMIEFLNRVEINSDLLAITCGNPGIRTSCGNNH